MFFPLDSAMVTDYYVYLVQICHWLLLVCFFYIPQNGRHDWQTDVCLFLQDAVVCLSPSLQNNRHTWPSHSPLKSVNNFIKIIFQNSQFFLFLYIYFYNPEYQGCRNKNNANNKTSQCGNFIQLYQYKNNKNNLKLVISCVCPNSWNRRGTKTGGETWSETIIYNSSPSWILENDLTAVEILVWGCDWVS